MDKCYTYWYLTDLQTNTLVYACMSECSLQAVITGCHTGKLLIIINKDDKKCNNMYILGNCDT